MHCNLQTVHPSKQNSECLWLMVKGSWGMFPVAPVQVSVSSFGENLFKLRRFTWERKLKKGNVQIWGSSTFHYSQENILKLVKKRGQINKEHQYMEYIELKRHICSTRSYYWGQLKVFQMYFWKMLDILSIWHYQNIYSAAVIHLKNSEFKYDQNLWFFSVLKPQKFNSSAALNHDCLNFSGKGFEFKQQII